ncbi:S41 family peptidase [Marivirga salinae]|uniref:S41 family peptidase n=1 Tax=Marivirga salinarum TaxID=3059078 RepID=A0AA51RC27_9BACT|nr:S41 family peptidase [Marivirga sp. BDSF4-3]WMN11193.1 S41 family peptidase [Marivirga sp. BDSF4-3]
MMNRLKETLTVLLICFPFLNNAQSAADVVRKVQELMLENYIFLDKAKETNAHLDSLLAANFFEDFDHPPKFAQALSVEMQKITKDKHLNIVPPPPPPHPNEENEELDFITRHLRNMERFRNGGFGNIDLLAGNVGYVELKGFRREDIPKVDAVMEYFSTADAIIIDLRENGGGNSLGLYWSSYFLKKGVGLSGKYERRTDSYSELLTVTVKGQKRLEIPLFILTSDFTFSAAEAFAYDLQSRKRAVIVGENTGGGAHPVNFMPIAQGYGILMPYARSINPITESNWEGIGVTPDIPTTSEDAFEKARKLAQDAAKSYREEPFNKLKALLAKNKITEEEEAMVYDLFKLLLRRKHLEDFMINHMGYFYLDNQKMHSAFIIFKTNLRLFPDSPNAHDSFAEFLALQGKKDEALNHYQQAVTLAKAQDDEQQEMYKRNLLEFESKINR